MAKRTIIFILLLALTLGIAAPAAASTAPAGELSYELTVPAGREAAADHLRDDDYRTRFTLTAGQRLSLSWKGEADGVLLQWFDEKQWYSRDCGATIRFFSEDDRLLSENVYCPLSYRMYLPAEGASRMEILAAGGRQEHRQSAGGHPFRRDDVRICLRPDGRRQGHPQSRGGEPGKQCCYR